MLCKLAYAVLHILRGEVADNEYLGIAAVAVECVSHVVLAVGAGEYRDKHAGLCDLHGTVLQLTAAGVGYLLGSGLFGELCLEYRLKNAVPLLLEGSNV